MIAYSDSPISDMNTGVNTWRLMGFFRFFEVTGEKKERER